MATTRPTVCSEGGCRDGNTLAATAAAMRNRAGEGTLTHAVRWFDNTANNPSPATTSTSHANGTVSVIRSLFSIENAQRHCRPDFPAHRGKL